MLNVEQSYNLRVKKVLTRMAPRLETQKDN